MRRGHRREPPRGGRSFLPVDDFCRITGVDRRTVQKLMATDRLQGVFDDQGRAVGLWDDTLPTQEELRRWGLRATSEYAPDKLRSTSREDLVAEATAEDSGPTWTMSWKD